MQAMGQGNVTIKGTSEGLTITIGPGNWQRAVEEMTGILNQRASFFKGGRVLLVIGERLLNETDIQQVGSLLSAQQMTLWSINSLSEETRTAAQKLGLEVTGDMPAQAAPRPPQPTIGPMTTQVIQRTIRSGQSIAHAGHIVILGDVNPGAEIRAGGHVIVWGKLRGTVHAGAYAPDDAFVCALELTPTQLIIGHVISRSPGGDKPEQVIPERAFVQNGQIIAEAWP